MTLVNETPSIINYNEITKGTTPSDITSCGSIDHTFQAHNEFPAIKAKTRKRRNQKVIPFFDMNRILERSRKLSGFFDVSQSELADKPPAEKKRLRKNPAPITDEGPLADCNVTSVEGCSPTHCQPRTAPPCNARTCDICLAKFKTYNEASLHEPQCRHPVLDHARPSAKATPTFFGIRKLTECDCRTAAVSLSARSTLSRFGDTIKYIPKTAPPGYAWTCDICQSAKFRLLDDAISHEQHCNKSNSSPLQIQSPLLPKPSLCNRHISKQVLSKRDEEQLQGAWKLISELSPQSFMIAKQADQSVSTRDFMLLKPPKSNNFGETTYCDIRNAWVNEPVLYYYIVCCLSLLPMGKRHTVLKSSQVRDLLHGGTSLCHTVFNTDAFTLDVVFIPVHDEKHWSLITIFPLDRLVKYFDSCGRTHTRHLQAVKACAAQMHAKFFHHRNECKPWSAIPCPWRNMKQRNGERTAHCLKLHYPPNLMLMFSTFSHLIILDSIRLCNFCMQVCRVHPYEQRSERH